LNRNFLPLLFQENRTCEILSNRGKTSEGCSIKGAQVPKRLAAQGAATRACFHSKSNRTVDQIVDAAGERFGQVDILVNNAGIFHTKPFTEYSVGELDSFLSYLRGTFVLSQATVRQMRRQGQGGAIVNIGTILASNGVYGLPSSAPIAAKGASRH
jgi:NAD(P)-dependent dehydrogenase (short-subunit alcohol dehydrogenase family)